MKTPYDVLGIPLKADNAMIRAALRKAAKAYHPDLNAGDPATEQHFRQVIDAYHMLRNPRQRAAYDQFFRRDRRKRVWRFATTAIATAGLISGCILAVPAWRLNTQRASAPPSMLHTTAAKASGAANRDAPPEQPRVVPTEVVGPGTRDAIAADYSSDPHAKQDGIGNAATSKQNPRPVAVAKSFQPTKGDIAEDDGGDPPAASVAGATKKDLVQARFGSSETALPRPSQLSLADTTRAERLLALGVKQIKEDGNVSAARLFFQSAADMGLAAAALRLAETYDSAEMERLKTPSVMPDRALARRWYERARELGAPEADERLKRLSGS